MTEASEDQTIEKDFVIQNKLGLHARPAALFVQTANQFESEIEVIKEEEKVDGKSIMGIMTLAAHQGCSIRVRAVGPDAQEAINSLSTLIEGDFGE